MNLNVTLKLDKKAIIQKDNIKYLGVIIDSHLNWKHHILNVSKKISRSIGVMYRIRKYVNINILKSIYYSLIYSHIVYAIQVWGSANDTELEKILILQKKAVRMMVYKDQYPKIPGPLNPTKPIFLELGILKIHDVFKLQVIKFIYDCLSFNTPRIFWNWFILSNTVHNYNTTSTTNVNIVNFEIDLVNATNILHTQFSHLVNYGAKMLRVAGPLLWNGLPEYIRNSQSAFKLKANLKEFYFKQYVSTPKPLSGHYYVSKFSICCKKLTITKMHTFFVPPYLPSQTPLVRNISKDGLKIKIFNKK